MADVWEFHHLQWCYSIDGRVSSGVYVSREKAEAASREPQHLSKHSCTTRPVHHWPHLLGRVPATVRSMQDSDDLAGYSRS